MKKLILPVLGLGACLTGLAVTTFMKRSIANAHDVYLLIPHADKTVVETNEFLFDAKPGDPTYDKQVLGIYGIPTEERMKLLIEPSQIKRPKLKPELAYVAVDKSKGENPWQLKTVVLLCKAVGGPAWLTGLVLLLLAILGRLAAPAPAARGAGVH